MGLLAPQGFHGEQQVHGLWNKLEASAVSLLSCRGRFYLLFTAFGRAPPARVPPHRTGAAELGGRRSARGLRGSGRSRSPRPAPPSVADE
jgi:hypothetical protein